MTEQDLHRLSRKDLLEIMIEQGKEMEALKAEYGKERKLLKEELEKARKALQSRKIAINEAGSIAVAALQINGIFEAAQAAGQQYVENIRSLNERQTAICAQRDADSRAKADEMLKAAAEKCEAMETACREKCVALETEAKQRSEAYWSEVSKRLQTFYENHQELKKLLHLHAQL